MQLRSAFALDLVGKDRELGTYAPQLTSQPCGHAAGARCRTGARPSVLWPFGPWAVASGAGPTSQAMVTLC
jgi:hypothetical protein